MTLPPATTPLYNHPLPAVEAWLSGKGCEQDSQDKSRWTVTQPTWRAELELKVEQIAVRYLGAGEEGRDILRVFPYSLSRQDLEEVIFSGP